MGDWSAWIGREEWRTDTLDPALAVRWLATLDRAAPADSTLPQGIHFCLCTPDAPTAALEADGHPARDESAASFMPPIPLPRRMWAASDIAFLAPLSVGAAIARTSRIVSVEQKEGRSGALGFVEVEHLTKADGTDAVREVQTLVYREASAPDAPLTPPEPSEGTFDSDAWDVVNTVSPLGMRAAVPTTFPNDWRIPSETRSAPAPVACLFSRMTWCGNLRRIILYCFSPACLSMRRLADRRADSSDPWRICTSSSTFRLIWTG